MSDCQSVGSDSGGLVFSFFLCKMDDGSDGCGVLGKITDDFYVIFL